MKRVCELGYTWEEVEKIVGDRIEEFKEWMFGQTMALCREHGEIVYTWDLDRFLMGLPIVD